jgi:hypothetical protein
LSEVEISVVCPVGRHAQDLSGTHREYAEALARTGRQAEFLYVLDGRRPEAWNDLRGLEEDRFPVRILTMARGFGEATALQVGFERARGRLVLTIPDRPQLEARVLLDVLTELDRGEEAVVTFRHPRTDALLNRLQSRIFHWLARQATRQRFHDLTCGVRGFTRQVAVGLDLYGDQHRFIPVIALRNGHRVHEIPGVQHRENRTLRLRAPGVYVRRVLDLLNIYFLARFTRKPLRFFGLFGALIGLVGFAISAYLAAQRLLGFSALANRPLLLLGVLLIVLGVQVTAIGLLGEIIIFFASRRDTPQVREVRPGAEGAASPHGVSSASGGGSE